MNVLMTHNHSIIQIEGEKFIKMSWCESAKFKTKFLLVPSFYECHKLDEYHKLDYFCCVKHSFLTFLCVCAGGGFQVGRSHEINGKNIMQIYNIQKNTNLTSHVYVNRKTRKSWLLLSLSIVHILETLVHFTKKISEIYPLRS